MANLPLRTAARIAGRELRAARGKFVFVLLSVAIGVAALTGVRGFSASFRATLLTRARSIMAADVSARMFQQPTPEQQRALVSVERRGVRITPVTELLSMASSARTLDPLLVSLKAVDPAQYPFYGTVELQPMPGEIHPALAGVLRDDSVVVAEDMLIRLQLHVGDQVKLGDRLFRIAGVVVNEPDRLSGSFAAGPRVLISRGGLESSGLLAPGSHAGQRYLFKMPAGPNGTAVPDRVVADLKAELERSLPESQVVDYREINPALTQGLDRATALLSLMSLVALVLGAVGVAMAMRAHLQQRLDTIATMKALGASSGQVLRIYVLQTLLLGLLGGLLGLGLGVGVQVALPRLLARLINVQTTLHLQASAILTGLGAGVFLTLLFALPPLLDVQRIRPILILRRATEDQAADAGWAVVGRRWRLLLLAAIVPLLVWLAGSVRFHGLREAVKHWGIAAGIAFLVLAVGLLLREAEVRRALWRSRVQVGAGLLILLGLTLLASTLSDSVAIGRYFSLGLFGVLAVLLLAAGLVLRGLRWVLERTRLQLPSVLRHGLANLYRPGNPSAALLAALGLGVMQIMTVYLVQRSVVHELHVSASPDLPNVFLIDITNEEITGVRALLAREKSVTAKPEFLPVVSSRLLAIDGVPAAQLKLKNFPKRMLQSISLTWFDAPPPGTTMSAGTWWTAAQGLAAGQRPLVTVNERTAERLGVHVGSHITFAAQDTQFTAAVVGLTKSDGQHAFSRAEFILPQAAVRDLPTVWYGGVHAQPDRVGELQRALYKNYPTVTVINVAAALETIRQVVLQITYVVQFLAAFSIFAGAVILASSIAGTRYRRLREIVVLKTLGATRARIAAIFSIEFAVLGLVAGLVGVVFANLVARGLLHSLEVGWQTPWLWNLLALALTAVLTVATGWAASHRLLGQKPLEVLREE